MRVSPTTNLVRVVVGDEVLELLGQELPGEREQHQHAEEQAGGPDVLDAA